MKTTTRCLILVNALIVIVYMCVTIYNLCRGSYGPEQAWRPHFIEKREGKVIPTELATPDWKLPKRCGEAPSDEECLESGGVSGMPGFGIEVQFATIRLPDGSYKNVVTCDDYTGKPELCHSKERLEFFRKKREEMNNTNLKRWRKR